MHDEGREHGKQKVRVDPRRNREQRAVFRDGIKGIEPTQEPRNREGSQGAVAVREQEQNSHLDRHEHGQRHGGGFNFTIAEVLARICGEIVDLAITVGVEVIDLEVLEKPVVGIL